MISIDILLTENELSDKLPTQITVLLRFMALFELSNYRSLEWLRTGSTQTPLNQTFGHVIFDDKYLEVNMSIPQYKVYQCRM